MTIKYLLVNVVVTLVVLAAFFLWMACNKGTIYWDDLKYTFTHDYAMASVLFITILLISYFAAKGILA